ncbi:MAG: glutaminyl-peptide cyclotransferase [Alistipes sp.]|nr:glutaminyl-peptide cyclotransferase [Alistipes sp.]
MEMLSSLTLAACMLLAACGSTSTNEKDDNNDTTSTSPKQERAEAPKYGYNIVAQYPHDVESYTQGLEYVDGTLWEGTGQEGKSHLMRVDLKTGKRSIVASLPKEDFGEGITHYKERIYQLTWLSEKAYVYDAKGNIIKTIPYSGEGWGITTDGNRLFMSDGTSALRIVDPETFATLGIINVSLDGYMLSYINELEWVDGYIWANVYTYDIIVKIDPKSGEVVGYVELGKLRHLLKNNPQAEAFNGIAYNPSNGHFYVTGKNWNSLFEIEIQQ